MFAITVAFGTTGQTSYNLMYRSQAEAEKTFSLLRHGKDETVEAEDDYGYKIVLSRAAIVGVLFEDMERTKMYHIERALHQARMNVKLNQLAQGDPVLKTAGMLNQMPHMHPMGGRN